MRLCDQRHFNPLFPYGKRLFTLQLPDLAKKFQSTLPIREETCVTLDKLHTAKFQSTLPIREETNLQPWAQAHKIISIHSSHTGRDIMHAIAYGFFVISIHSSHTGRDYFYFTAAKSATKISIHSSHTGRDLTLFAKGQPSDYFNPLFPYGKRLYPYE